MALSQAVYDMVEQVLTRRPGDLRALQNRYYAADTLSLLALRRFDMDGALDFGLRMERAGEDLVRFNPSSLSAWNSWATGKRRVAGALDIQGRVSDAIDVVRAATALADDERAPPELFEDLRGAWGQLAFLDASLGRNARAREAFGQAKLGFDAFVARQPEDSDILELLQLNLESAQASLEMALRQDRASLEKSLSVAERAVAMGPGAPVGRDGTLRGALSLVTETALRLGRYAEAESAARQHLEVPITGALAIDPEWLQAEETRIRLAHAIAGRDGQPRRWRCWNPNWCSTGTVGKRAAWSTRFVRSLAHALYVSAIAQPEDAAGQARRQAALAEATEVLASLTTEARQTTDIRVMAEWIAAAGGTVPGRLTALGTLRPAIGDREFRVGRIVRGAIDARTLVVLETMAAVEFHAGPRRQLPARYGTPLHGGARAPGAQLVEELRPVALVADHVPARPRRPDLGAKLELRRRLPGKLRFGPAIGRAQASGFMQHGDDRVDVLLPEGVIASRTEPPAPALARRHVRAGHPAVQHQVVRTAARPEFLEDVGR
jgi:tetratricopeptide (TPR) repeat protein